MPDPQSGRSPEGTAGYRFGVFEADAASGELRRQGIRLRLNAQPFQLLIMLLERPGELVSREEICARLWPDGTFVDYEHGVNSAVNRIREALGDSAANPRFLETLARRGYRFIAPVTAIRSDPATADRLEKEGPAAVAVPGPETTARPMEQGRIEHFLTTPEELPQASHRLVRTLLILFQLMYLAFYVGALANLPEIEDLLRPIRHAPEIYLALVVSAGILIPVRAFVLFAVLFRAPGFERKFLKLWRLLVLADVLWSLSPILLLHHINSGVALACTALLVYSPFVQRSLVLMTGDSRERAGKPGAI
jgi:cholera toxin transcriptional activator